MECIHNKKLFRLIVLLNTIENEFKGINKGQGTGGQTPPTPIVRKYQVTHFRFLDTIRNSSTPPQEYVRNEEQV